MTDERDARQKREENMWGNYSGRFLAMESRGGGEERRVGGGRRVEDFAFSLFFFFSSFGGRKVKREFGFGY